MKLAMNCSFILISLPISLISSVLLLRFTRHSEDCFSFETTAYPLTKSLHLSATDRFADLGKRSKAACPSKRLYIRLQNPFVYPIHDEVDAGRQTLSRKRADFRPILSGLAYFCLLVTQRRERRMLFLLSPISFLILSDQDWEATAALSAPVYLSMIFSMVPSSFKAFRVSLSFAVRLLPFLQTMAYSSSP